MEEGHYAPGLNFVVHIDPIPEARDVANCIHMRSQSLIGELDLTVDDLDVLNVPVGSTMVKSTKIVREECEEVPVGQRHEVTQRGLTQLLDKGQKWLVIHERPLAGQR